MNNGLPSLLHALFGKKDLDLVSLEEMVDLVNEFPSFNAGQYLLARKLKMQEDEAYARQTQRTALYFNNPFWLQTLLEEGNQNSMAPAPKYILPVTEIPVEETQAVNHYLGEEEKSAPEKMEAAVPEPVFTKETNGQSYSSRLESVEEEILTEEASVKAASATEDNFTGRVLSFDDLISKYNIETVIPTETENPEPEIVVLPESDQSVPHPMDAAATDLSVRKNFQDSVIDPDDEELESREEVVNEYGVFEQEVFRKSSDRDLDAFDPPTDESEVPEATEEAPVTELEKPEIISIIPENNFSEETIETAPEQDYDAFDRPFSEVREVQDDLNGHEKTEETAGSQEVLAADLETGTDEDEERETEAEESDQGINVQMQQFASHLEDQLKSVARFDPKQADAIVFAPYHMIDYFASQGIKLVLEDQPTDPFGKQLKSFTDWLKVMKKLPVQKNIGKTDDHETEQIRHFAAHSIEERDILTESMAEVLAKQGMYENAIALYQKLSLIYPPKSAYFASRIEQIKGLSL